MTIKERLNNFLTKKANKLYQNLFFSVSEYPLGNDDAENQVEKGYLYNPDVYSIINLITTAAKTVKWNVYEVKDEEAAKDFRSQRLDYKSYNPVGFEKLKAQGYEEIKDSSNQLVRILKRPNPLQAWSEWIENVLGYKLITGNSFIHGVILENGVNARLINEMWAMPAQLMEIKASKTRIIEGYELSLSNQMNVIFSPDEVMHLKYWNPDFSTSNEHLWGLSPLKAGARVVRQSNDTYTANAALLQNSGASGILSIDPETMTEETASKLQKEYEQKYTGAWNRGKIIMAGAKMDWKQIGLSPVDLNIIESQKMSLRDLCNIYQVNSSLLNDPDNKTYQNVREARKALYMEKIFPELDSIRDELNRWLVERYNNVKGTKYYIDYDINSVPAIQEDMKLIVDRLWNAWWLTGNEKRNAMGFETDEAMDRFFIPTGMMPMSREQLIEGLGIFDDRGNGSATNDNNTDAPPMPTSENNNA